MEIFTFSSIIFLANNECPLLFAIWKHCVIFNIYLAKFTLITFFTIFLYSGHKSFLFVSFLIIFHILSVHQIYCTCVDEKCSPIYFHTYVQLLCNFLMFDNFGKLMFNKLNITSPSSSSSSPLFNTLNSN